MMKRKTIFSVAIVAGALWRLGTGEVDEEHHDAESDKRDVKPWCGIMRYTHEGNTAWKSCKAPHDQMKSAIVSSAKEGELRSGQTACFFGRMSDTVINTAW